MRRLPFARSKACPSCGGETARVTTPLYFRPLRALWPGRSSTRECRQCKWEGFHLHDPEPAAATPLASEAEPKADAWPAPDGRALAPLEELDLTTAFAEADATD